MARTTSDRSIACSTHNAQTRNACDTGYDNVLLILLDFPNLLQSVHALKGQGDLAGMTHARQRQSFERTLLS